MAPPKAKGQKMGLGEFLTDASLGSWADEMEDIPVSSSTRPGGYSSDKAGSSWGGGGGHTDRGYSIRESLPLPSKPPYTVHLGNMSFDATEGDIQSFFEGCDVTHVRIVEDKLDRKPKGFGYAEFATLEGLKKALEFNSTPFQGRNIRISVAEPQKDRNDQREVLDWTRKGPLADVAPRRGPDRTLSGNRGQEFGAEAGPERPRRNAYEQGDGKPRDFSNWERKGPLTPTMSPSTSNAKVAERPLSHDGPRERRNSPAWGEGRSQEGSRPPKREFADKPVPERAPTAAELDTQWRSKMRPDAISGSVQTSVPKETSTSATPAPAPAMRPKLNLQKRTVSQAEPSPALPTGVSDNKASPFGAARPIDTAARDKEIEEKLRLRKEHEEKAREERRLEEKSKDEERSGKEGSQVDRARVDKAQSNSTDRPKDSHDGDNSGQSYQILRREADSDAADTTQDVASADLASPLSPDTHVKPQEIVRDLNGGSSSEATTSGQLEEEGWSTVSKPSKGRKGGTTGTRALAS